MGALFCFPAWILLGTQNKKMPAIVKSSTAPMIMATMAAVFKLAFFVGSVPRNTRTELFAIPSSFTV